MLKAFVAAVFASLFISISTAYAGNFEVGTRYGRSLVQDGGNIEIAARYFPASVLSLGASLGYANLQYDKGWYYKKTDTIPLGGYVNAHLPLPMVKPYAGIGGLFYCVNDVASPNPTDRGSERSGTLTVQGGVDISLPAPKLSLNIEARRLVSDRQTLVLGGVWFRF